MGILEVGILAKAFGIGMENMEADIQTQVPITYVQKHRL